jgi:signal transduction histidine kinase/ActR/RegA family two-component response regulator
MNVAERHQVLVWAPRGRDAPLAVELLDRHGVRAVACDSVEELLRSMDSASCAVLTHESLSPSVLCQIECALKAQPAWSDFPFVLLTPKPEGGRDAARAWPALGNVTVLERPTQVRTLLSAITAAQRARGRQYEAKDAILRRDQFLAMLGHELRNPLAAIVLAVERRGTGNEADAERRSEIVARQVRHLTRLVDDLLDVGRVTLGKVALQAVPLDLNDVLERCLSAAELSDAARGVELHRSFSETPPIVSGDPMRLEEVFSNLVANALKFSPGGSRVDIETRVLGGEVVVDVRDVGVGISREMLPRVFDLFAQGDVSLDRTQSGLGVGLTVVKALVELHSGAVEAHSDGPGKGSHFRVRLPLLEAERASAPPAEKPSSAALPRPLNVLVVDDNADLLEMTKDVLEGFGCQVQTASDGPTGLARLTESEPAIAFIDIGLPGLDGYELASEVRAVGCHKPWLVALTGYGQPEDRRRAFAAGFDQHLTKPVTVEALRHALGNASEIHSR